MRTSGFSGRDRLMVLVPLAMLAAFLIWMAGGIDASAAWLEGVLRSLAAWLSGLFR